MNLYFRSSRRMELSDAEMDRIRKEMRQSTRRMEVSDADKTRIREEMSRSFGRHESRDSCDKCDNTFVSKNNLTTSFYQMKDTTSYVSGKSGDMIADLGCPNTVLGRKNVKNFIDNENFVRKRNAMKTVSRIT